MLTLLGYLGVWVFGIGVGFWARKYWGKRDPESLAEADARAKDIGDEARRRF